VASSADGTKLVAVAGLFTTGQIYTSTDSGLTWTPRDSIRRWCGVASSADGTKLVSVEFGGQIYTSTGFTWNSWTTIGVNGFISGGPTSAIELQYQGNGNFGVISHDGSFIVQ
jgi:hypothetical protein